MGVQPHLAQRRPIGELEQLLNRMKRGQSNADVEDAAVEDAYRRIFGSDGELSSNDFMLSLGRAFNGALGRAACRLALNATHEEGLLPSPAGPPKAVADATYPYAKAPPPTGIGSCSSSGASSQGAPEGAPKGACKEGGDDMWPRDAALNDEQVVVEPPASKRCRKLTSKEAKLRRLLALPETDE